MILRQLTALIVAVVLAAFPIASMRAQQVSPGGYSTSARYYVTNRLSDGGLNIVWGVTKYGPHLGGINAAFLDNQTNYWDWGTSAEMDNYIVLSSYDQNGNYLWKQVWVNFFIDKSAPVVNGHQDWQVWGSVGWDDGTGRTLPAHTWRMYPYLVQHSMWNINIAATTSNDQMQAYYRDIDNSADLGDPLSGGGVSDGNTCVWAAWFVCSDPAVIAIPFGFPLCVAFLYELCMFYW